MGKLLDKSLKTEKEVDAKIKELDTELTTTSMSVAKERDMRKMVKFLEKSKQYYATFEALNAKLKAAKNAQYETKGKISELSKKIKKYNKTLDQMNEEFKSQKENKEEFKAELDKLEAKVQDVKKQIGDLFEKKNEIREQHYKNKFLYEAQLEELNYYDYLQRQKDQLLAEQKAKEREEAEAKRQIDEKQQKKEEMPNPFQDEIGQCGYLITQLKMKKRDHESFVVKLEAESKKREIEEERKKEIEKQAQEGKIQVYQKEEDEVVVGKNRRKKNKKKGKVQAQQQPQQTSAAPKDPSKVKIEFKYDVVKALIELGVDVPEQKLEEIDQTIEQLEKLKTDFEERGQKKIDEIFEKENWQEQYDKYMNATDEDWIVNEEEEQKPAQESKPKPQKYDISEDDKPLE
jgi:hypothetical protein